MIVDIASLLIVVAVLWAAISDPMTGLLRTPRYQYRGGNQAYPRMAWPQ